MRAQPLRWKIAAAVALAAAIAAALGALATHELGSVPLGFLVGLLLTAPCAAWLAVRVSRPWTRVLDAVSGGIRSLHDRDFSVTITPGGSRELVRLVTAYNSLGDVLRRERLDIYQRELLLDTVLQTTPLALTLTNATGRIVYGNIAARQLLRGGRKLEGLALEALLEESPAALREALKSNGDTLFTMEIAGEPEVYHLSRRAFVLNGQPHELLLLKQLTRELAAQEVVVWKKVIRVIAHELNNSLAPIRHVDDELRNTSIQTPRPGVPEPNRRQYVDAGGLRASIGHRDPDEHIFGGRFRIFHEDVEIPVLVEDTGIKQFVFGAPSRLRRRFPRSAPRKGMPPVGTCTDTSCRSA